MKRNRRQKKIAQRAVLLRDIAEVLLAVTAKAPPAQLLARIAAGDYTKLAQKAKADYYDQLCVSLPPYWRAYYAHVIESDGLLWRAENPTLPAKALETMVPIVEEWAKKAGFILTADETSSGSAAQ